MRARAPPTPARARPRRPARPQFVRGGGDWQSASVPCAMEWRDDVADAMEVSVFRGPPGAAAALAAAAAAAVAAPAGGAAAGAAGEAAAAAGPRQS